MATGIILPSVLGNVSAAIATSVSAATIISSALGITTTPEQITPGTYGPWTPPQWSTRPISCVITVSAQIDPTSGQLVSPEVNYVFDVVVKVRHRRTVKKTSHPVLTGSNISDNAYNEPARLILEIGMSDAMASYASQNFNVGQWVGGPTKSVSAWQVLKFLEASKQLLVIATRLDVYYNMLIVDIATDDDSKTNSSLKAIITLEELISGVVISVPAQSALPQVTGSTSSGVVQSYSPDQAQVLAHQIPSTQYPNAQLENVPGSGDISSNSLSQYISQSMVDIIDSGGSQ